MHKLKLILLVFLCFNLSVFAQTWTSTNGPTSGVINGFAVNSTHWFCATEFGVFSSTDMGQTWSESVQAFNSKDALMFGSRVYVGAYEGVRYSDDNGGNWTFENVANGVSVSSLADYGTAVLAGTSGTGVFIKLNSGAAWTATNQGLTSPYHLNIQQVITHNGIPYLAEGSNLFKWNVSMQKWDSLAKAGSGLPYPAGFNCIASNGANLYTYVQGWGFYYSTNNGQTWTQKNTGLANVNTNTMLKIVAHNNDLYIGGVSGFFKNDTYLTMNWGSVANIDVYELFSNGSILMRGGEWDGFRYSDDNGVTWKGTSNGITDFVSALTSDGTNLFAAGYGTGVTKMNNAGTWSNINNFPETGGASSVCMHKSALYAARYDLTPIQKSTNQGATWTSVSTGIPANVALFQLLSDGTNLYAAGTDNFIYYSTNDGTSWQITNFNQGGIPHGLIGITANAGQIWAATDSGIFFSFDYGSSWAYKGMAGTALTSIILNNGRILLGTESYGVWASDDYGWNWQAANLGMNSVYVNNVYAIDNQRIVAGTRGDGIFYSGNNGNSWTLESNGLGNWYAYAFAKDNTYLYASTIGGGVFKSLLSNYVSVDKVLDNNLLSVFPNPTKGIINVEFDNEQQGQIQLSVFDINGKQVYQSISEALMLNEQINLGNFSSGIYFVKISTEKGSVSKRVVVE